MGFFSRQTDVGLRERLDEQAVELAVLQKTVRDLTMEWEDWYEKFRNLYARINKRRQREATEEPEGAEAETPPFSPLAQRLLDIQNQGTR